MGLTSSEPRIDPHHTRPSSEGRVVFVALRIKSVRSRARSMHSDSRSIDALRYNDHRAPSRTIAACFRWNSVYALNSCALLPIARTK